MSEIVRVRYNEQEIPPIREALKLRQLLHSTKITSPKNLDSCSTYNRINLLIIWIGAKETPFYHFSMWDSILSKP